MNKLLTLFLGVFALTACSDDEPGVSGDGGATPPENPNTPAWHLEWSDDFDGTELDETVWSKTDSGTPDWQKAQSKDERCFELSDGTLKLKGIRNDDTSEDPREYLCGGIWSMNKKAFGPGSIQVKARLGKGAPGAWPAIWLMPSDTCQAWPYGGEIDIMERLNADSIAYQTVHSHYTYNLKIGDNPPQGSSGPIDPADFNVYALEMYPDSLVFFINDKRIFCYPRIETDKEGQFPFDQPYYLKIDMQLGGSWVGPVHMEDLPVEMEVDWVRFYQK